MAFRDLERELLELFAEECPADPVYRKPRPDGTGGLKLPRGMTIVAYPGRSPRESFTPETVKVRIKFDRAAWKLANAERIKESAAAYRRAHREERKLEKRRRRAAARALRLGKAQVSP